MDLAARNLVRQRAGERCEYCRLTENAVQIPFPRRAVIAKQHGGGDDPANLCLACDRCNLYKGPNLSSIDPHTQAIVTLFHPREHRWPDHVMVRGAEIVGLTPTGRATVRLLNMNAKHRLQLRSELLAHGELQP
jgi:hypothetical protein